MDQSRTTEIRVGLVTLTAFILLTLGIILGQGFSLSQSGSEFRIRLSHSGGLTSGSPVLVNGVERGSVKDVFPEGSSVIATIEIDHLSDIHPDASARVSMLEITGGKKVEIFPGIAEGSFDPALEMAGETSSDIGDLVTQIGDVSGDLVRLLRRIDTITAAITEVIADTMFLNNMSLIASNGATLLTDARIWLQENRNALSATVTEARAAIEDLRRVVNKNEPELTSAIAKLDARLGEMESTLAKADTAIVNVDSLVMNVNGIVHDIRTNNGFANAALYDTNFRRRIDTAIMRLNGFVKAARVNGVNVNVGIGHK